MNKRIKKGLTLLQTHPDGRQRKVRVNKIMGVSALCYVHDIVGWKKEKPVFASRLQELSIPIAVLEKLLEKK